jgi:predicted MFS family arabinose efflux permease
VNPTSPGPAPGDSSVWRPVLAGLCSSLVGIGLARFAYTPLLPALIAEGWFSAGDAAYLGAANLAGYLAGAVLARRVANLAPAAPVLRAMMLLAAASLVACAWPISFLWFFAWRFAAGLAGGVLMVLAATTILPHVPAHRRGLAGGAIFTGVGFGIVASGTLVPLLMRIGLAETWWGLGALTFALTLIAWRGWPSTAARPQPTSTVPVRSGPVLVALFAEYALNAIGLVPHMVFLVDFIARGLGHGLEIGSLYWVIYGIGAAVGPLAAGALADRIGFRLALRLTFAIETVCIGLLALYSGPAALVLSSLVIGAFTPGVVPLVLGRLHELIADAKGRTAAWSTATTAFSVGQAAAAYGFSYLFTHSAGGYALLFALGAGAMCVALAIDLAAGAAFSFPKPSAERRP